MVRREPLRRELLAVLATLALLTVAAWVLTLAQMRAMASMGDQMGGMAMGESTRSDPGVRLIIYLGMWVTMMAAMMLPAAAPMILMFGTVYRTKRERGDAFVPTWVFVVGYLAVWTGFGACAWAASDLGEGLARAYPGLGELGPRIAAAAMIAAGLYQLTPLKERCLSHCRSPLTFVMHNWRSGVVGAWRMGVDHGVYCVGCCWALFVLLVVVGVASLPWMGLITIIVCAEKLLPHGKPVTVGVAAVLVALGLLTLALPELLALSMG